MKKETWKLVVQILISVLTALGTSLGVTSCMNHKKFILINSGCKGRGFRGFVQYLKLGFLQNT